MSALSPALRASIAVGVLLAACGPKAGPAPLPILPGDGTEHTAKPPTPTAPATVVAHALVGTTLVSLQLRLCRRSFVCRSRTCFTQL